MSHPLFPDSGRFPSTRLRRNRANSWSRRLVAESRLGVEDLIWPIFVSEGNTPEMPVESMPGVARYSISRAVEAAQEAASLGILAVAIFPQVPEGLKDLEGSEACNPENLVCRAVRAIRKAVPKLGIICDVALDPYTSHGHDGIVEDKIVVNDDTVHILCNQAVVQADAGCDVIAPSDMMDGRVGAIRKTLDKAGYKNVQILSYAAKYSSAFYGPFRDAIAVTGDLGPEGKRTYQMDPANGDEALRETALDIAEGADMVMVKPGLPYLDVLYRIKEAFGLPTFVYQVSGEYAMLARTSGGKVDPMVLEALIAFKRAGADGILTYFALEVARGFSRGE